MLNRGDPPFVPIASPPTAPVVEPVTPHASSQAKALLDKLHAVSATQILSGQRNDAASPTAASDLVFQTTGKQPAIYAAELDAEHGQAVLDAAVSQAKAGSVVSLTWKAQNPADEAGPAAGSGTSSANGQKRPLTDFEWRELMTPGTHLNQRWATQADELAAQLKHLDEKGVAVLFTPYPEANGKQYWWANRSGIHGSAALYRMTFDRLVNQDHVKNLLWGWQAAPGGYGPQANGPAADYFPGLLYVDAISIAVNRLNPQFRAAAMVKSLAGDKAIGVTIAGGTPDPASFSKDPGWSWFELAPLTAPADDATAQALKTLYGDAQIVSR
jgi:mannan endo-1,4-beta-mannosidase